MKTVNLIKKVEKSFFEECDEDGTRRIRIVTTEEKYFLNSDTRHNPTKTFNVEYY